MSTNTMLDAKGKTVKLLNRHPLIKRKKPGPQEAVGAEVAIEQAAQILDLLDQGLLETSTPSDATLPNKIGPLSREIETNLAFKVHTWGDVDARNKLVLSVYKLARQIAGQSTEGGKYRAEDLMSAAYEGVLRSVQTFEPQRGLKFSTYTVFWIRAKIQRFKRAERRHTIAAIPGAQMEVNHRGERRRPVLVVEELNRPCTFEGEQDNGVEFGDFISSDKELPNTTIERAEVCQKVRAAMRAVVEELGGNDEKRLAQLWLIVNRRLLAETPETLAQIGAAIELSREGVRLIENKLMKRSREILEAEGICP